MQLSPERGRTVRSRLFGAVLLVFVAGAYLLRAEQFAPVQTLIRSLPAAVTLSQTRVGDIVQDNKGFLWIGTQYGLNRFDGFRMRQFFHDPGDANSVGCSYIHALFKDRSGNLWVSCDQSLDRYEPETESFTHFHLQAGEASSDAISALVENSDTTLWLATSHGLVHFAPKTGIQAGSSLRDTADPQQKNEAILWLEEDRANQLWAMTRYALVQLDRASGKVIQRIPLPYTPAVGSFHEDRWGNFWVLAAYRLYRFDRGLHRVTEISTIPGLKTKTLGALHSMIEDADGDMWFGTENAGIIHIAHDGPPERYFHQIGTANDLPSDRVTALFQDRCGDIWVGFHDTAPRVIQRNRTSSRVLSFQPEVTGGLRSSLSTSLFEVKPGQLLIGTSGALQLFQEDKGEYSEPFPFLAPKDVFAMHRDQQNRLWFATDKGIYRFDPRGGSVEILLRGFDVYRFLEDRAGRLWVLLRNDLLLYFPATDSFKSYAEAPQGEGYFAVAEAPDGTLWLGGSRGVKQLDVGSRHIRTFPYAEGSDKGPSDARVNSLLFDTRGRLWAGTQSGLNSYDPQEQRFHRLAGPGDLGGQIVSCVLEDRQQQLWMSSNQGLLKFDPERRTFTEYSSALGVAPMDLSGWGACFKNETGRLFFGGFGGIVLFIPEEITQSSVTPGVVLTSLIVNGHRADIGPHEILRRSITVTDKVELNHAQNDVALEFAALDFRNIEAERFRYRLLGVENSWVVLTPGQHVLNFTHLARKSYTLQLQAASLQGEWLEPGVKLDIQISKPWWATWWMFSIYLLCFSVIVWLLYCFRIRQLAAILDARMEGRVRERTALARDLHDTLLQDFQGMILRFAGATSQLPAEDFRRTELTSAITRAEMSLIEGRDALQEMRTSPMRLVELVGAFEEVAKDLAFLSPAKVEIRLDPHARPDCDCETHQIFQVGKEALRNALQHARATRIQLWFTCDREQFELLVRDNGIGIPEKLASGDAVPGHWGIRGMRERAERLGGTLSFSLVPDGGTVLRMILPNPKRRASIYRRLVAYGKAAFFPVDRKL